MGQSESKSLVVPLDGFLYEDVCDKYRDFWEDCVRVWMNDFGFFPNASLSVKLTKETLRQLETDLKK